MDFLKNYHSGLRKLCSVYFSIIGGFCTLMGVLVLLLGSAVVNLIFSGKNFIDNLGLEGQELAEAKEGLSLLSNVGSGVLYTIFIVIAAILICWGIFILIVGIKSFNGKYRPNQIFVRSIIIILVSVLHLYLVGLKLIPFITFIVAILFVILSYFYKSGEISMVDVIEDDYYYGPTNKYNNRNNGYPRNDEYSRNDEHSRNDDYYPRNDERPRDNERPGNDYYSEEKNSENDPYR